MKIATSLIGTGTNLGHRLPLQISFFKLIDPVVQKVKEVPMKVLALIVAAPAATFFVAVGLVEVLIEDIV